MLGDAIRKLKLDRRLSRRRGWIESDELDGAIEELPDLSEKAAATADESEAPADGGAPAGT